MKSEINTYRAKVLSIKDLSEREVTCTGKDGKKQDTFDIQEWWFVAKADLPGFFAFLRAVGED